MCYALEQVYTNLGGTNADRAIPRVWLYLSKGKEGAGAACPPQESGAEPDGHIGKAAFCPLGRNAHRVIGEMDHTRMTYEMFTDGQNRNKTNCSDLGDCYTLREFYEIDLRRNCTVPC